MAGRPRATPDNPHRLTQREWAFVQAYLDSGVVIDAYRKAYKNNASDQTAYRESKRVLASPYVSAAIAAARAKASDKTEITIEKTLKMFAEIAFDPGRDDRARLDAGDKIMKVLGGYRPERHEHSLRISLEDLLDELDGRASASR